MFCHVEARRTGKLPLALGGLALAFAGLANGEAQYRFDDSLLMGSGLAGGTLERFNRANQVDPGTYHVDVYLNGSYASRTRIEFRPGPAASNPASANASCAGRWASAPPLRPACKRLEIAWGWKNACQARPSISTPPFCASISRCPRPCWISSHAATWVPTSGTLAVAWASSTTTPASIARASTE